MSSWFGAGLHFYSDLPNHTGEFPCDGHLDFIMMHEALPQLGESCVQPVLRLPRDLLHPARLPLLPEGQRTAYLWFRTIVGGAFHQQPAQMRVAAFGDATLFLLASRGIFSGR